jgi:hypothetical protein
MSKLCECGCKKELINEKSMFLKGHSNRNRKDIYVKRTQNFLNLYGVKNPSQLKEVKKQKIQTCQYHYSTDNPSQSNEIKKKKIQTSQKHYGTDNPNQSEEVKEKKIQIFRKHYNTNNPNQSEEVKEKIKQTCIKHFGVDHFSKTIQGRQICRTNYVRMIENQKLNGEPLSPRIGDHERPFLNEFQKYTNYNIIRNDNSFRYIIGRFPDGHIPELKLFIQFDERQHFIDNACTIYRQTDIDCTLQLASLGYIVFRVSEKNWKENKEKVINDFKQLVGCLYP